METNEEILWITEGDGGIGIPGLWWALSSVCPCCKVQQTLSPLDHLLVTTREEERDLNKCNNPESH